ncbi:MAG: IS1634 family transposase [bacterium]
MPVCRLPVRCLPVPPACPEGVLFDTTNYYTFMASKTKSELARRGKNKSGRDNLRQIGVALLVDRAAALPLHYKAFAGNMHDPVVFAQTADEMMSVLGELNPAKLRMTVVFDKGLNSPDNIRYIDDKPHARFITTYSNHFAPDVASADTKNFAPLDIEKNQRLEEKGKDADKILARRTRAEFWGRERTAVVTYNPVTARKQRFTLDQKLETLRETLPEWSANYRRREPHWRDPGAIRDRYIRACEDLYIGSQYYRVEFAAGEMSFRKDIYQFTQSQTSFGKNIIITDNHDWSNEEIVQLSLDRYLIEHNFRASKSRHHVETHPVHHWTDGKLRCHILTCAMTLAAMKILEIKTAAAGLKMSGPAIMAEMRTLHSVLVWPKGKKHPLRIIEEPTETQQLVLKAFGHCINADGVLQPLS